MFLTGFKTEGAAVTLPPQLIFWPTFENYQAVFGINFFRTFAIRSSRRSYRRSSSCFSRSLRLRTGSATAQEVEGRALFLHLDAIPASRRGDRSALCHLQPHRRSRSFCGRGLNLLGTLQGLIILYTAMNLPIAVWMLRSFFEEMPRDVLDAARIDGAGLFREMTQIVLPMVASGPRGHNFHRDYLRLERVLLRLQSGAKGIDRADVHGSLCHAEGLFWAKLAASCTMAVLPDCPAGLAGAGTARARTFDGRCEIAVDPEKRSHWRF